MNLFLLPLSIVCGLTLCGTAVSVLAVHRAYYLLREMTQRAGEKPSYSDAGNQALRDTVEALAAQIHDLQRHPPVAATPGIPRPGLNINKRSHALRMHRRGQGAEQIAAALELPRQEVDLLLKVHRIVISNV